MRSFSFFAVAAIAAVSLAVSGCGGVDTASNSSSSASTAEGSSSTAPATGEMLTAVSFDVTGMTWKAGCGGAIKSQLATALPGVEVEIPELGKVIIKGDDVDAAVAKKAIETAANSRFTATQF